MRWPLPWTSWPDFLVDYPWIIDGIEWLRTLKDLWDQYNSLLILVGLWLVARKLGRERERLEERVDTLGQHVKAATDAADSAIAAAQEASATIVTTMANTRSDRVNGAYPPSPAQPSDGERANWNRVNSIWSELKDRIDLLISDIPQKRVRAKYSHMHRRSYQGIIAALLKDGALEGAGPMLLNLDRKYSALRFKPKEVTRDDVALFEDVLRIVNGTRALPPIPTEPAEEDIPDINLAVARPPHYTAGSVTRAAS